MSFFSQLDLHGDDAFDVAVVVADEILHGGQIHARVGAELRRGFFLAVVQLVDLGPLRPRDCPSARSIGGIGMISSCVRLLQPWRMDVPTQSVPVSPPPMHEHVLALRGDGAWNPVLPSSTALVFAVRKSIAKCTPLRLRPSTGRSRGCVAPVQITVGVEILEQQLRLDVLADVRVADELDAFLLHQLDAARDDFALVELHVRDAVHQQAARAIGALEHGHRVAGLVELRGGGESRGTGTDDGDLLAGARRRAARARSSLLPSPGR